MVHKRVFLDKDEAWEFAKSVVANGGTVIDYGVISDKYYIQYTIARR